MASGVFEINSLKLILEDILKVLDNSNSNHLNRCEYFNNIIDAIPNEDYKAKLKLTGSNTSGKSSDRFFLKSDSLCSSKNLNGYLHIERRRDILIKLLESATPNEEELSNIFIDFIDIRITKIAFNNLKELWAKEKVHCIFPTVRQHIDAILINHEKEHMIEKKEKLKYIFIKWLLFISCFSIKDEIKYRYFERISACIKKRYSSKEIALGMKSNDEIDSWVSKKLNESGKLLEFNIATNHGLRWIDNHYRSLNLKEIIAKADRINILLPNDDVAENFSRFTRNNTDRQYLSQNLSVYDRWKGYISRFNVNNKVNLQLLQLPLLRQYHEFVFEDSSLSSMFVIFYTYGDLCFDKNLYLELTHDDYYYDTFKYEFNSLLNINYNIYNDGENQINQLFKLESEREVMRNNNNIIEKYNSLSDDNQNIIKSLINQLFEKEH